jgi:hypothetical protein
MLTSPAFLGRRGGRVGRFQATSGKLRSDRLALGLGFAAALGATLALGGCGGIEFKGKVFDYAGLSGGGTEKDVKMAERPPLVLPPDTKALPPPGEPPVYAANGDWPTDTDKERKRVAVAKEAQAKKEDAALDPENPYAGKPTLLDKVFGRKKKSDEAEVAAVPEPDPSDKTPEDKAREARALAANGGPKPLNQPIIEPPKASPDDDPFHPAAPDSYKTMSGQSGN